MDSSIFKEKNYDEGYLSCRRREERIIDYFNITDLLTVYWDSSHIYFCAIHKMMKTACDFIASSPSSYLAFYCCWYLLMYPQIIVFQHIFLISLQYIEKSKETVALYWISFEQVRRFETIFDTHLTLFHFDNITFYTINNVRECVLERQ